MEETKETVEVVENEETGAETQTAEQKEVAKTFTQEEVNNMIADRLKRVKTLSDDDLKEYNAWKESQKTEAERQIELVQELNTTKTVLTSKEQLLEIYEADVPKEYTEFVQFQVSKMEGDFKDNLETYLKENPKYLQKEEAKADFTGMAVNKKTTLAEDGVTAILKEKYPDRF